MSYLRQCLPLTPTLARCCDSIMTDETKTYSVEKTLIRLNELIGELYALWNEIPGAKGHTDAELDEALTDVRTTIAHAAALGMAKITERPQGRH